jgi:hypothetical protein
MPAKKKPVASKAQRKAYRSITTPAERKAQRATSGKGAYAKLVAGTGKALRKSRKAAGYNPSTGKKKVTRTLTGVGSGASRPGGPSGQTRVVTQTDAAAAGKATRKPSTMLKTGPTQKTRTVSRIAKRKGISRVAANKIRKSRKG